MEQKEKDAIKKEIALFRYGLISPILTDTYSETSQAKYFKNVLNDLKPNSKLLEILYLLDSGSGKIKSNNKTDNIDNWPARLSISKP